MIGLALLDMQESVRAADGVEQLRQRNVLNPAGEGDALQLPARMPVRLTAADIDRPTDSLSLSVCVCVCVIVCS